MVSPVFPESSLESKCLRSLYPAGLDFEFQKNQIPVRVRDTCLWTLHNHKYLEWRDADINRLLWISAAPGCGKSVLARCIVDEDLPSTLQKDRPIRVLYYFFKLLERRTTERVPSYFHNFVSTICV